MRQSAANRLLTSVAGGNSEADKDNVLLSLQTLCTDVVNAKPSSQQVISDIDFAFKDTQAAKCGSFVVWPKVNSQVNALTYVAGYVVHKVKRFHSCISCSKRLCGTGDLDTNCLEFTRLKSICEGEFGGLQTPSHELVSYLFKVERLLSCCLKWSTGTRS